MTQGPQPVVEISEGLTSLATTLYQRSGGADVGLAKERFCTLLEEVAAKYLPEGASTNERQEFYSSLKVEDLALAHACAAGSERAWEVFMHRFREKLYDIAGYIAKESSAARELADSLYADLYGTTTRDGQRVCKLASYTGRGSLEGWLRTVLAQEYVNRYRKQKRLVSMDEESEEGEQFAAPEAVAPLREARRRPSAGEYVSLSGADPLNLLGIVAPGPRLPALTGNRLLYRDGLPIAAFAAGEVSYLESLDPKEQWQARNVLLRRQVRLLPAAAQGLDEGDAGLEAT